MGSRSRKLVTLALNLQLRKNFEHLKNLNKQQNKKRKLEPDPDYNCSDSTKISSGKFQLEPEDRQAPA